MSKRFKCFERLMVSYSDDTKEQYGWTILFLHIGQFSFDWFTECGEWFIYFYHNGHKTRRVLRLSSAGNYYSKYDQGDSNDQPGL